MTGYTAPHLAPEALPSRPWSGPAGSQGGAWPPACCRPDCHCRRAWPVPPGLPSPPRGLSIYTASLSTQAAMQTNGDAANLELIPCVLCSTYCLATEFAQTLMIHARQAGVWTLTSHRSQQSGRPAGAQQLQRLRPGAAATAAQAGRRSGAPLGVHEQWHRRDGRRRAAVRQQFARVPLHMESRSSHPQQL